MITSLILLTAIASVITVTFHMNRVVDAFEQATVEAITEAYEADIDHDLQYGRVDEKQLNEEAYTSF